MKKLLLLSSCLLFSAATLFSQDTWTPSELSGFGNSYNENINAMHVFNGQLYVGNGNNDGRLYRSATGNLGSFSEVFAPAYMGEIDAVNSTTEGGGVIYASTYTYGMDPPTVYSSTDGTTWNPYYYGGNYNINQIIPFKGLGTVDDIYLVEQGSMGSVIQHSTYNSNDPSNASSSWNTVFDLGVVNTYTYINSSAVFNGKLYVGTDNGGYLYYSADGTSWTQNTAAGVGIGNPNTNSITALASFSGALYAGTYNYYDGAQLWKTTDETTWTLVNTYPNYDEITNLNVGAGELWVCLRNMDNTTGRGEVLRSGDGITFNASDSTGFNQYGNYGDATSTVEFNNFIYCGTHNWQSGGGGLGMAGLGGHTPETKENTRGGGYSSGGQIWRFCLGGAPPTVNLGPDALVCGETPVTFDAGAGATDYLWSDGSTSQTITTTNAGTYYVLYTGTNGCINSDTVELVHKPTPSVSFYNPESFPVNLCKGDTLDLQANAYTNVRIPFAPVSRTINDSIFDYATIRDTVTISGVNDLASATLLSVTIDSLYHTYDGDLSIGLYAPDGSGGPGSLSQYNGGGTANYVGTVFRDDASNYIYDYMNTGPYTGTFAPQQPFYSYSGPADGDWVLEIYDQAGGDIGVIKGWTIQFAKDDSILTFSWTPSTGLSSTTILNPLATPTVTTTYTLVTTNSSGCTTTQTAEIDVPALNVSALNDSLCYGTATTINVTGGTAYHWTADPTLSDTTGSGLTANPLTTTTYYVMDTTLSGCVVHDSIQIHVDVPFSGTTSNDTSVCFADTVHFTVTPSGGTAPYSYYWNDGTNSYYTSTIDVSPSTSTTYTVNMTDAYSCFYGYSANVAINPSTDIYGTVTYSGGPVTHGTAVAYKYHSYYLGFDTVQVVPLDAVTGQYHFTALNHADYIVKIFADTTDFPSLIPTYYGNEFLWDSATVFTHDCVMNDTLDVTMSEDQAMTGTGFLRGRIVEGPGYGRAEGDPIPGIDVKLGKNPGGALIISTESDSDGYYYFTGVPNNATGETYSVFVDIPGLGRISYYTFTVDATNNAYYYLNYIVDSVSVYIDPNAGAGVNETTAPSGNSSFSIYPNPTNNSSDIVYELKSEADVVVTVYNVLGIKVADVLSEHKASGLYKTSVNSKAFDLQPGVYFVSMVIDGKSQLHRWVVTK